MKYLNAMQAAKRIGVSDKTVRAWIKEGRLSAVRTASNRLAIPESEVESLKREFNQFAKEDDTSLDSLSAKVIELEQRIAVLEKNQEKAIEQPTPSQATKDASIPQKHVSMPKIVIPGDLPEGTVDVALFAQLHGIPRNTIMSHIKTGIAGEQLKTIERPKPGRPDHTERFLTPDLQQAALNFWKRHGVKHALSAQISGEIRGRSVQELFPHLSGDDDFEQFEQTHVEYKSGAEK